MVRMWLAPNERAVHVVPLAEGELHDLSRNQCRCLPLVEERGYLVTHNELIYEVELEERRNRQGQTSE